MRLSSPSTDPPQVGVGDGDERGSAALEFILVGLLMLVPLVYLVIALGAIQHQTLGAEAGARHVARAISTAADSAEASERADRVLASVIEEYGLSDVDIEIACRPAGSACPAAGATLVVTVRAAVALPLVPPVLGLERFTSIPIEATAAHKVSRFWGTS
jgi:Flp pilus assembly protein TadG